MKRRHVLTSIAGSLSFASGCLSGSDSTPETATSTTKTETMTNGAETTRTVEKKTSETEPTTTPKPQIRELAMVPPSENTGCSDDLHPVTRADGASYPDQLSGFKLEKSKDVITIGDEITFTLTNTVDEIQGVADIYHYNILRWDDGWTPVFSTPETAWTTFELYMRPDGKYRWPFVFTRKQLERENGGNYGYYVCSPLKPGKYRFAFFGTESTIATTFTAENP